VVDPDRVLQVRLGQIGVRLVFILGRGESGGGRGVKRGVKGEGGGERSIGLG
jgi:hypothetical protein